MGKQYAGTNAIPPNGAMKSAATLLRLREYLAEGFQAHQAKDLATARAKYLAVLEIEPENANANNLMATICFAEGAFEDAAAYAAKALAAEPHKTDFLLNDGAIQQALGRYEEAEARFKRVLDLAPGYPQAITNLLRNYELRGAQEDMIALLKDARRLFPQDQRYALLLSEALTKTQDFAAAIPLLAALHEANPTDHGVAARLGRCLAAEAQFPEAERMYRVALGLAPDTAGYIEALALLIIGQERMDEAVDLLVPAIEAKILPVQTVTKLVHHMQIYGEMRRSIRILRTLIAVDPSNLPMVHNLAMAEVLTGGFEEAKAIYEKQVADTPDSKDAWLGLSRSLQAIGDLEGAVVASEKAISLDPTNVYALSDVVQAYSQMRRMDKATAWAQRLHGASKDNDDLANAAYPMIATVALGGCDHETLYSLGDPIERLAKSNMAALPAFFLASLTQTETDQQIRDVMEIHKQWGTQAGHAALRRPLPPMSELREPGPVRIGLLSSDLRGHSVMKFVSPFILNHDRAEFALFVYSTFRGDQDYIEAQLPEKVHAYRRVDAMTDREIAEQVRADGIDVLIELNGMTRFGRLPVLSYRAAPIQIEWLGYPFTTGLPNVDYLLADPHLRPTDDAYLFEDVFEMPGSWCSFGWTTSAPTVTEPPLVANNFVTFGTLNNTYKYTPETFRMWAEVLKRVPNSNFVVVRPECDSIVMRSNIAKNFAEHGISADRVLFFNNRSQKIAHDSCYNLFDISLDTYPLTGGTTTAESLDMGVPVISRFGPALHHRISNAIINHVGVTELLAPDAETYVEKAVALAKDADRLRRYRKDLREQVRTSVLCDGIRFTRDFQQLVRDKLVETGRLTA